jgi:hypothetical protein
MKFSAIPLIDAQGVNDYVYSQQVEFTAGDSADIYLQMTDLDKNLAQHGYYPAGLRYVPATGSTLQITIKSIDVNQTFIRYATQPFTQDPSIWMFSILPTDPIGGTVNITLQLTEPLPTTHTYTVSLNAFMLCR